MPDQLAVEGKCVHIVTTLSTFIDREDGFYELYAPAGNVTLSDDTWCVVLLSPYFNESPSYILRGQKFTPICPVDLVQDVVEMAYKAKPHASASDLVYALNYYLDRDAFTDFRDR